MALGATHRTAQHTCNPTVQEHCTARGCQGFQYHYEIPCMQQRSHLPLAAVITPLAQSSADSSAIPVIDCGEEGPTRCSRCRAYINPFVRWVDADRDRSQFACNLCGAKGTVSDSRLAQLQRPEIELYAPPPSATLVPPRTEPSVLFQLMTSARTLLLHGLLFEAAPYAATQPRLCCSLSLSDG